jgi:TPR repeat protein
MTNNGQTLLPDKRGYKEDGRLTLGAAIIKLYRDNAVWRGSVDMVLIGSLILFLVQGFPSFSKLLDIFNLRAGQQQTKPARATQAISPNFAPVQDSPKQHAAASSKVEISKAVQATKFPRIWINNPTPGQKKALDETADLVGVDNEKAIEIATEKADTDDVNYKYLLGVAFVNQGYQFKESKDKIRYFEKALYWYKEAGTQGHPEAQYQVAQLYRLGPGNIQRDIQESMRWYEMAAINELGSGAAENELGRIYEKGESKPQDLKKAFEYYKKGAEKGDSNSQANLGAIYYNGTVGPRNIEQGNIWTRKAAEQNHSTAQLNLAILYKRGRVTGQSDYNAFLDWAQLSSEGGNIEAMLELGNFYREGAGGTVDHKLAAKWYRQAALKKNPRGQFLFAEMYDQGLGVPQDLIQAYVYYSLSRQGGFAMASGSLATLKLKMSPAQLDHAEKMMTALKE